MRRLAGVTTRISIRQAHPGDTAELRAIAELLLAQLREHGISARRTTLQQSLQTIAANPRLGFILIAKVDRQVVGVAYAAAIVSLEHSGPSGWLEEMYVRGSHRNRGIGSGLLRRTIAHAARRGWKALDLEIDTSHSRVAALYVRHGFAPLARTRYGRRVLRKSARSTSRDLEST